jgi:hypothetical protein
VSASSAPGRKIDWDNVIATAEAKGAKLRAASADSRAAGKVPEELLDRRMMRGLGVFSPILHKQNGSESRDRLVEKTLPTGGKDYRRCRLAGRPPPPTLRGVFDREAELAQSGAAPYRRMRARSTSPVDKLPMNWVYN